MDDSISRQAAIDEITEYGSGDSVYMSVGELKRRIEQLPSAQPEQTDNAEFWRKRAEEYGKICFDLYMSMLEGTKFDSVKITEDGIVLMQKGGKND